VLVATDARRREVYWAAYADGKPLTGPGVAAPAEVAARAAEWELTEAVGDGAVRYAETLGLPVRQEPRYPPAAALAALAADRVLADRGHGQQGHANRGRGAVGETLTPLYLRRPDAVAPGARKAVLPA
jgi:tRNA A37 threonylcarbamoyladenosine modification protein TsaB